ncbi:pyridoxal phosphate-dependent aminotransferase [Kribbella solani]|uniref:histidinol-phosphate transaminase n=1 Tax=Kribbella solani TaxID=236067 RepID=A0A841DLY1_9ACTN|nr:histidinol-phosphate transaminase [Kribbella solani]MBB5977786.1 histidinol-phosphate aminotransferase [Kribbella solani]
MNFGDEARDRSTAKDDLSSAWYAREPAFGSNFAIRLSLSESVAGASQDVEEALTEQIGRVNLYPDLAGEPLNGLIADHFGLPGSAVLVTNGSDEALLLSALAAVGTGDRVLLPERTYTGFRYVAEAVRAVVAEGPCGIDGLDVEQFLAMMPGAKLAFIANPHNPTGLRLPNGAIQELCRTAARVGCHLVVDEAYAEFAGPEFESALAHLDNGETAVVRTFSKAHGLAGIRCGYLLATGARMEAVRNVRRAVPFSVSRFALAAASAAIGDSVRLTEAVADTAAHREQVVRDLRGEGIEVVDSVTNFVLAHLGPATQALTERLHFDHGVTIRDARALGYPGWARITVCPPADWAAVFELIRENFSTGTRMWG